MNPERDKELIRPDRSASDRLVGLGGEFRSQQQEQAFRWDRLGETMVHGRWLLIASAVLNTLFFASDWRFYGMSQFWIAIPARTLVVAASLLCWLAVRRCRTPDAMNRVMAAWMVLTTVGVTALVSSHSELALFVVLLLPMIFYLGVPLPFRWTAAASACASAALMTGYEAPAGTHGAGLGLALALLTLNCCLALVLAQSNRFRRLEWHATRTARAIADELAVSRETMEKMFAAAPVPMVVTAREDGRILHANDACAIMFGIAPEMIGTHSFHEHYVDPGERERLIARLEKDGRVIDFEMQARCAAGVQRTVLVKAATIDLPAGRATIAGIIDISDRKAVELSLEWLASTDPLTKLPNRLSFFSTARAEMMRAIRLHRPLALLMIDLDHFKVINDTFGHHGGDMALKAFGALCLERLRGTDIIGRLGGEEFGILLPDTDVTEALAIAEKLCADLRALRLPTPNEALQLSASIGLTLVRRDDRDLDMALARADRALYAAKRAGRARVFCEPADIEAVPLRAAN
ncbi:sensor domain-containing diguanylate cyclase [Sphingomonas profundi]|uniref:sensor domain-containing diguanylate cyclase n=1 Tax=Alterirhizorhabdus profundi TaxID=2681549 RepID=UPI0018D11B3F|nr:sensor domain-containing diguanylate cyclase [Sphingomonas profundi]